MTAATKSERLGKLLNIQYFIFILHKLIIQSQNQNESKSEHARYRNCKKMKREYSET